MRLAVRIEHLGVANGGCRSVPIWTGYRPVIHFDRANEFVDCGVALNDREFLEPGAACMAVLTVPEIVLVTPTVEIGRGFELLEARSLVARSTVVEVLSESP